MEYKQVILIRADLKLPKGKLAAQAAHASVEAVHGSGKNKIAEWRKQGMPKIVLKVSDLKELHQFAQIAKDSGLSTALITDAGRTVVEPGTITCLAIGPDSAEKIDRLTGKLKML